MTLEAPFSRFLWFRSNWGLPVLASEEGWGVVWWENSCHIKTCGLGGFSSTSHVDNAGLGKCFLTDCHMNAGADSKRQCWHCDWETGGKHQRNPGSVFLGFKSRIPGPRLPRSQTETGIPNDLFAGQDWDKDQLQRWAWDGRVQGGCHQVEWNWIGSFPCESHGSLESFSWATLLMLKLITGAARMGLRWLRSLFTKPSLNSQGSENHRLDLHCHEYDSWLLYQGGDRCAGSAIPKRGKSDWPERRDGEEEILFPSCTSPSCKPLYKDLAWSTLDLLRWRPSAGRADAKWTWSQKPRLELLNWFIFTNALAVFIRDWDCILVFHIHL